MKKDIIGFVVLFAFIFMFLNSLVQGWFGMQAANVAMISFLFTIGVFAFLKIGS